MSTSTTCEEWAAKEQAEGMRSWHKLKQKKCEKTCWFVNGKCWGGTHSPLRVFTEGRGRYRSKEAKKKRAAQWFQTFPERSAVATRSSSRSHAAWAGYAAQNQRFASVPPSRLVHASNHKGNGNVQPRPHQWFPNKFNFS